MYNVTVVTFLSNWLLLQYKLPVEPSAPRVYVWRKLKRVGAVLILDSMWILPNTPRTLEQLQWLAAEITEVGGEVLLWQGQPALTGQDGDLRRKFILQVDEIYAVLLAELQKPNPDLEQVSRQYQQVKARDYFQSALGGQVRTVLLTARGENT